MDFVIILVTPMQSCARLVEVKSCFRQVVSLESFQVLRAKLHTTSYSEQNNSREERKKGTNEYLPAKAADTSLSLTDGSVPLKVDCSSQFSIHGEVTSTFMKTTSKQNKDQGLNSEKAKTKDTFKIDEPIAQPIRCKFKQECPPEPREKTTIWIN